MRKLKTILLIFLTIIIYSCINNPQKEILGTWAKIDGGMPIYEFFEDGTITITNGPSLTECMSYGAIYEFPAKDSIKIISEVDLLLNFEPTTEKFHFHRGNLVFTTSDGNSYTYERLK